MDATLTKWSAQMKCLSPGRKGTLIDSNQQSTMSHFHKIECIYKNAFRPSQFNSCSQFCKSVTHSCNCTELTTALSSSLINNDQMYECVCLCVYNIHIYIYLYWWCSNWCSNASIYLFTRQHYLLSRQIYWLQAESKHYCKNSRRWQKKKHSTHWTQNTHRVNSYQLTVTHNESYSQHQRTTFELCITTTTRTWTSDWTDKWQATLWWHESLVTQCIYIYIYIYFLTLS